MKYRSKPVVIEIEAIKFLDSSSFDEMSKAWGKYFTNKCHYNPLMNSIIVNTLEGDMRSNPGDWIIYGTLGEFYPCKDEVFRQKYEEVEE